MKPTKILLCADPANLESADRMKVALETVGANVYPIRDYNHSMLPHLDHRRSAQNLLNKYHALVVMGNDAADVAPRRYGQPTHPHTATEFLLSETRNRAKFESLLIQEALKRKMPLFGICGGMQQINVECGGTLVQHLPDIVGHNGHSQESAGIPASVPSHGITTVAGTKFAALTKPFDPQSVNSDSAASLTLDVNSRHHQAVHKLGHGLREAAYAEESKPGNRDSIRIIEAIEANPHGQFKDQFLLAVQFHPELMETSQLADAIAKRLVSEASSYKNKKHHPHDKHKRLAEPLRTHVARVYSPDEPCGITTVCH